MNVDVGGVEHDGAHVGRGVGKDGLVGDLLQVGEDGSRDGDAIDGDAGHVERGFF